MEITHIGKRGLPFFDNAITRYHGSELIILLFRRSHSGLDLLCPSEHWPFDFLLEQNSTDNSYYNSDDHCDAICEHP